jgi:hypothetical protein
VQGEFVSLDRVAQVVLDDFAHLDRLVHGALEERKAVPAVALRLVERGVGEPDQSFVVGPVLGGERYPDRHPDRNLGARDLERAADRIENAPGKRFGIAGRADSRLNDRELVAAEARQGVGPAKEVG